MFDILYRMSFAENQEGVLLTLEHQSEPCSHSELLSCPRRSSNGFRGSFVAAFEVKQTSLISFDSFLGQFMLLSNAVFVDRANRQQAFSAFKQVAQVMKEKGTSLFIFAEGTRNRSPHPSLLPFKVCDLLGPCRHVALISVCRKELSI